MKIIKKTCVAMSFCVIGHNTCQWWHPVASSEALELLHWAMCAATYRRIAMAIKTASKVGVFLHRCLFACCPGGRWGNFEQVVA